MINSYDHTLPDSQEREYVFHSILQLHFWQQLLQLHFLLYRLQCLYAATPLRLACLITDYPDALVRDQ